MSIRSIATVAALAVLLLALIPLSGKFLNHAQAQGAANIYEVNTTGNGSDANAPDGICDTDTTTPGDQCTLRAAIEEANTTAAKDAIIFNIPSGDTGCDSSTGVCSIQPTFGLPPITKPVIIDGYTQPGASHNTLAVGTNAVLKIVLDGTNAGATHGLEITSGGSVVTGLVINRFQAIGLLLNGGEGNHIHGNFIGTDVTGKTAMGNAIAGPFLAGCTAALAIFNSSRNLIGGDDAEDAANDGIVASRNLISGNIECGIAIFGTLATLNRIEGNHIGTDVTGNKPLGNGQDGVLISIPIGVPGAFASNNTIGGTSPGSANVISNNSEDGIVLSGGASSNFIFGNHIGIGADGTTPLGNSFNGVAILGSDGNFVGTGQVLGRNVISANTESGVLISGNGATGNIVLGNYIGTDFTGNVSDPNGIPKSGDELGNKRYGVLIDNAPENTIGGTVFAEGNVISGNETGVRIIGGGAIKNKVFGNFIGTDSFGLAPVPNETNGIEIVEASDNIIGGTHAKFNLISANLESGVLITGSGATGNRLHSNFIGVALDGVICVAQRLRSRVKEAA